MRKVAETTVDTLRQSPVTGFVSHASSQHPLSCQQLTDTAHMHASCTGLHARCPSLEPPTRMRIVGRDGQRQPEPGVHGVTTGTLERTDGDVGVNLERGPTARGRLASRVELSERSVRARNPRTSAAASVRREPPLHRARAAQELYGRAHHPQPSGHREERARTISRPRSA